MKGENEMDKESLKIELRKELSSFEIPEKDIPQIINRYEGVRKNKVFRDLLRANKKRDLRELKNILWLLDNSSENFVLSIIEDLALLYDSADYIVDILSNLKNEEERSWMFTCIVWYKAMEPEENLPKFFIYVSEHIREFMENDE